MRGRRVVGAGTKVTSYQWGDGKVDLMVDATGQFFCDLQLANGEKDRAVSQTLEGLKKNLDGRGTREAKVRVEVPFTMIRDVDRARGFSRKQIPLDQPDEELVDIVAVGIHERNRVPLYRDMDGKAVDTGWHGTICKRMTADEKAEYLRLQMEHRKADAAKDKFLSRMKRDARDLVEEAIRKADLKTAGKESRGKSKVS